MTGEHTAVLPEHLHLIKLLRLIIMNGGNSGVHVESTHACSAELTFEASVSQETAQCGLLGQPIDGHGCS